MDLHPRGAHPCRSEEEWTREIALYHFDIPDFDGIRRVSASTGSCGYAPAHDAELS
jgi:hypothetical protein